MAADPAMTPSEVKSVVGRVEIGRGTPPVWRQARRHDLLQAGESVRTGDGARAEIDTASGTVRMYEQSLLRFPTGPDRERRVDLMSGSAIFDLRTRSDGSSFEVRTPRAVVLAKGTRFTVNDDAQSASVAVARGLVGVRRPDGQAREVLVHPGFGVSGGAGAPFSLGLLDQHSDAWTSWSMGGTPSAPAVTPLADSPVPAAAEPGAFGSLFTGRADDLSIAVVTARGERRVRVASSRGFDQILTQDDLHQVMRGNTVVLGPDLLALLATRGVSAGAFAHQMLDLL
jgi:hypothetical protein